MDLMRSFLILADAAGGAAAVPEFVPDLVFVAKTFGLGVAVLVAWLGILLKDRASDKVEIRKLNADLLLGEKAYGAELKLLLKENLNSIPALIRIVESITPQVNASNDKVQINFNASVDSLKGIIAAQLDSLRTAIAALNNK